MYFFKKFWQAALDPIAGHMRPVGLVSEVPGLDHVRIVNVQLGLLFFTLTFYLF